MKKSSKSNSLIDTNQKKSKYFTTKQRFIKKKYYLCNRFKQCNQNNK